MKAFKKILGKKNKNKPNFIIKDKRPPTGPAEEFKHLQNNKDNTIHPKAEVKLRRWNRIPGRKLSPSTTYNPPTLKHNVQPPYLGPKDSCHPSFPSPLSFNKSLKKLNLSQNKNRRPNIQKKNS
ncbi:hypothetical protein C922_05415 [Plasmodium inui San Antonio 1]|uniref:Uncharacterized protein n=1 Tax=Plasmodium inui San Antonio 1 TaxID=1237626 RepID=W7A524_9APIC|nr:hypothetical protein C922_05415 [Plasmodium inui San Antonio 1]EUD64204.1 hypothetical protein C922_05415 [Plasmodium inui San Antonio 1]